MIANRWYSIAQTTVFDTSCGINITFGESSSVLFTASVKYGVSSLNISSCSIEESYNISVRLRETESKWCVDLLSNIEINPTIDITDSPYWVADNSLAGNGAVIAIIENISKEFNTTGGGGSGEGGESLFDRINIGTDADPQYAVVPKDFNGSYVHIVSRGDVLAGGEGTPGEPGQGATTLGGLNNVDAGADEIYNTDKVLVKLSLDSHWRAIDLSSVVGLDTNALERYLTTNNYATTSDIETAIGPVSEKVNRFDDRIVILESLGLSLVEQDGTTYLKSEHSFCTEKDIFAGGLGEEGASGGIIQQVYGVSAFGQNFDANNLTDTFNAHAINSLYTTIQRGVKNPYALTINGASYDGSSAVDITISGGGGGVSGDYLPLSGGTLTGSLTVPQILNTAGNVLISQSSGNSTYVGNASVKTVIFGASGLLADINGSRYNIVHSGNIGSYNAGSATKLQTARSIWGQPFDGTGDVKGRLYVDEDIQFNGASGVSYSTYINNISQYGLRIYYGNDVEGVTFLQNGNVLIGATDDNGSKLRVGSGDICVDNTYGYNSLDVNGSSRTLMYLSAGNVLVIGNDNATLGNATYISGSEVRLRYGSSKDLGLLLNSSGNVVLTKALLPNTSISQNIGSYDLPWLDVYTDRLNTGSGRSLKFCTQNIERMRLGAAGTVLRPSVDNSLALGETDYRWSSLSAYYGNFYGNVIMHGQTSQDASLTFTRASANYIIFPSAGILRITYDASTSANTVALFEQGKLTVIGNFVATGEVTSGSDERYKRIESYAEIDIETIANAPIINFKWTDREDDRVHLGSTAQYWANTSLCNGVIPTTDEKLWTMNYGTIALGGLVSVAKKVVNHEDRLQVVEKELAEYKEENKQLKQQLNEYRRLS